MAKSIKKSESKKSIPIPASTYTFIEDAINSKKHKAGGRTLILSKSYKPAGQRPVMAGAVLIECNDGFFKVKTDNDDLHYRLGPGNIKDMEFREEKTSQNEQP